MRDLETIVKTNESHVNSGFTAEDVARAYQNGYEAGRAAVERMHKPVVDQQGKILTYRPAYVE